ncbi:uncharacterized protein Fot_41392 [Forsythia ovata]|uniref:Uncharacterized protein n=1 Tax=Forsythia ovata TaxID=205694 RepID=A0ABD1RI65_9LAMI
MKPRTQNDKVRERSDNRTTNLNRLKPNNHHEWFWCDQENSREFIVVEENKSPDDQAVFDRKVSRSRYVGCGSRSFSGDFFDRISTGFGDCALRGVESQREGKSKISPSMHKNGRNNNGQVCI